ncbi:MAG: hypothetical protein LBH74_04200 [Nitrososphaerota archaeon]|jgi:hypothetical protein|nr:hypothetical protein [Nitrososphaerota archaeon]
MKKLFSGLLFVLLISTLFFTVLSCCIGEVQAQTAINKLPTPELVSVTYKDYSYDVPASTTTDPFTGKIVENPAYHVNNRTLTFVIDQKNVFQANYGSYQYYLIRMKGIFSNEWHTITELFNPDPDSPLTTKVVILPPPDYVAYDGNYFPLEGQADFQVQAQEWVQVKGETSMISSGWHETLCAESGWSNIKTVNFGQDLNDRTQNQPNPDPNQTSTDQTGHQPELSIIRLPLTAFLLVLILCPVIIVVLIIALVHEKRKNCKTKNVG